MRAIQIVKDGENIGVLPCFDEQDILTNLRDEICEDFDLSNFSFSFEESLLDCDQESLLKVESISEKRSDVSEAEGCLVIKIISFAPPSEPKQSASSLLSSESSTTKNNDDSSAPSTSFASSSTNHAGTRKPWKSFSKPATFLRSPSSWELRGVKIYSLEEIEVAKGIEKKRRVFWNDMAKKMCKETTKPKQIIGKTINDEWRKHQANLLLEEQDLLSAATEAENKGGNIPCGRKLKSGTIGKNAQRIRNNQDELAKITAQIDKVKKQEPGQKRKIELNELERTKKFCISDMKKAQDVMRKNLKVAKMSTVKDTNY